MVEIARQVLLEERPEVLRNEETRWELEGALERSQAHELAKGKPFSLREVNSRLRCGEHLELMYQQL